MTTIPPATPPVSDAPTTRVERCPLCGSPIYRTAFAEPPYEVRRCGACGLGYVTPRRSPQALLAMYAEERYWSSEAPASHGYGDYRADRDLYLRTFGLRLDHALAGGPAGGRALDVGCAAGFCMAALRERGFEVFGVEVSPPIAAHAADELGFGDAVHVGTLESAPYAEASFDLITVFAVVEHVPDPVALLRRVRTLLKPGGTLVLEAPDIDSPLARAMGRRWHHFKHAEHIYHFTPPTIRRLLELAGFRVASLTHRHAGRYVSAPFIAEHAVRLHPLLRDALVPLASRRPRANLYVNLLDEMLVVAR